jgi:phosphatidylinositol glycan class W
VLQFWALTAERVSFLTKNREGIVSLPGTSATSLDEDSPNERNRTGYCAIFLFGISTGLYCFPPDPYYFSWLHANTRAMSKEQLRDHERKMEKAWKPKPDKLVSVLGSYTVIWWALFGVLRWMDWSVSRRLVRSFSLLPYILG